MLKVNKKREVNATFYVTEEENEVAVKSATIVFDTEGCSTYNDYITNKALYEKNRREMRADEAKLNELRYKTEDEILADIEASEATK